MGIAKRHVDRAAPDLRAIADAVYFEHPAEAPAYALNHVGDQLAHQAVHRALALGVAGARHHDLGVLDLKPKTGQQLHLELALWSFDLDQGIADGGLNRLVECNRQSAYPRHRKFFPYQTASRISPPTRLLRASRSVITPSGVDSTCTPSPPRSRGIAAPV